MDGTPAFVPARVSLAMRVVEHGFTVQFYRTVTLGYGYRVHVLGELVASNEGYSVLHQAMAGAMEHLAQLVFDSEAQEREEIARAIEAQRALLRARES